MVRKKLIKLTVILTLIFSSSILANPNLDQWLESEKTYKDLINDGYEVKSYSINDIEISNGLLLPKGLIFFIASTLKKESDHSGSKL